MTEQGTKLTRFEQITIPHLNAAYNLARWLMRNHHDAEDAVQEAYLRAFRFFDGFRGGNGRGWLLAIVRNTCLSCLRNARARESMVNFDEQVHGLEFEGANPETSLVVKDEATSLRAYIEALPLEYREAIVMREIQQLSYKEISEITSVPLGTVMSRLSRARHRLRDLYATRHNGGAK